MTRWGLCELALREEVVGNPPTSRNDSLGVIWAGIEGGMPPTSRNDSLGGVGGGVEGGGGREPTNES